MKIDTEEERFWYKRKYKGSDWYDDSKDWIESYIKSVNHSHREYLINKISEVNPSSILEIGCNCGPNLYLLAKLYPNTRIVGIDINKKAINTGRKWFRKEEIYNVTFIHGKAEDISQFHNQEFDVVFSDAALMYIGPDKIHKIASDMLRITKQKIIMVERIVIEDGDPDDPHGSGISGWGQYKRDYYNLFRDNWSKFVITRINREMWDNDMWSTYGAIIEVYK